VTDLERWVQANAYTPDCCPDPRSEDMLDHAEPFPEEVDESIPALLTGGGFDPRYTPVDTLMAARTAVGLRVAEAMENC